ncbi:MAG: 2,3-bisphosphoglycerate-independent phosphoglycerate mutase [Solirubrobacteraceae bacterium]
MTLPVPCACLIVLDGWGLADPGSGNAVSLARTPVFDGLWDSYPHTTLTASGRAVGLPEGQMGNSEVGHLNLGAGAVIRQDLTRINDAVLDGVLSENPAIVHALTCSERVHLIGLVSDGGVHSSLGHLQALVELAGRLSVRDLVIHCFTDGRDTPPESGVEHIALLERWCGELWPPGSRGRVRIGSVVGRWYAMDRDRRWERIQAAYDLLVHGRAPHHEETAVQAVRAAYERGETDEFIAPTTVGEEALIRPWDSVLCFNFRPDRMREIVRALAEPGFGEQPTEGEASAREGSTVPAGSGAEGGSIPGGPPPAGELLPGWVGRRGIEPVDQLTTLAEYEEDWDYPIAFPPQRPTVTLAGVLATARASQLHVAETEKYAHVTYFFNGGDEAPYDGERRELAPSVRDVPTYDLSPEMSARAVTDRFLAAWREHPEGGFRFSVINFANPDMVGHTGVIPAAVRAIETVDACLREVVEAVLAAGGACLVTADHGNAEHMLEPDGSPNTAHTSNPVPLILTLGGVRLLQGEGILADVAPTVLALLGIPQPEEMSGRSLIL